MHNELSESERLRVQAIQDRYSSALTNDPAHKADLMRGIKIEQRPEEAFAGT